jgi:DNA-binding MarR family transcriptional regulator
VTKKKEKTPLGRTPDQVLSSFDDDGFLAVQISGDLSDLPAVGQLVQEGMIALQQTADDAELGRLKVYTLTEIGHDRIAKVSCETLEGGPGGNQEFRPTPVPGRKGSAPEAIGDAGDGHGGDTPAGDEGGDGGQDGGSLSADAGSPEDLRSVDGDRSTDGRAGSLPQVDAADDSGKWEGDGGAGDEPHDAQSGDGDLSGQTTEAEGVGDLEGGTKSLVEKTGNGQEAKKVHSQSGVVYPDPYVAALPAAEVTEMHGKAAVASDNQIKRGGGKRGLFLNMVAGGLKRAAAAHYFEDLGYPPDQWQVDLTAKGWIRGGDGEYMAELVLVEKIRVPEIPLSAMEQVT